MPQSFKVRRPGKRLVIIVLAVLAVPGFWAWASYRKDIASLRSDLQAEGQTVETACGPAQFASHGDGMPLLVVHGAGGGYDQGLQLAGSLASKGFRIIAVSRFGYLGTPLPADASAPAQADAYACLLDALGIPRAIVLGASAGAPSSVQLALRHPQRVTALVLLVPALFVPQDTKGTDSVHAPAGAGFLFDTALRWNFGLWMAIRIAPDTMTRTLLGTPVESVRKASAAEQAKISELLVHILPVTDRRAGLENDAVVVSNLERYALERVMCPTLIVSSEDDGYHTFEAARYSAGQIPGARFIGYPTGGHLLAGHQEELEAEIAAFLRGQ